MSTPTSHFSLRQPNDRLRNLPTYVFAWLDELKAAARAHGADLIDLGMGNPDRPTPQPIVEAIRGAYDIVTNHGYPPFKGKDAFREAVTAWMKRRYDVSLDPATEALCLSGSKEGLAHLTMAYVGEGEVSLVPEIYYPVLSRATWLTGGQVYHMPMPAENGFLADFDNIPADILAKARVMFLNYPNNPTGAVADLAYYQKAVDFCREHRIILASDMAYGEIGFDGYKAPSILEVPGAKDVAIEFHSFSKSFNMAGSRVGWAVGNAEIIHTLYALRTNVGYGTPATIQDGCTYALQHAEEFLPEVVNGYQARRDLVMAGMQQLGWTVDKPKGAMYIWLPVPGGFNTQEWTQHLIDTAGVVVTPGNAFGTGGEGWFRISLVSPEPVLQTALDRLAAADITYKG